MINSIIILLPSLKGRRDCLLQQQPTTGVALRVACMQSADHIYASDMDALFLFFFLSFFSPSKISNDKCRYVICVGQSFSKCD
jgi:hypothetical protein